MNIENLGDLLSKTEEERDNICNQLIKTEEERDKYMLKFNQLIDIINYHYKHTMEAFDEDIGYIAIPVSEIENIKEYFHK